MITVFIAFIIIGMLVTAIAKMNKDTIETIGNSYQTNTTLDNYATLISQTETEMETYMHYRSFESIDSYYHYQVKIQSANINLSKKPSGDAVFQKEYIVRQLTKSFIYYSEKTITDRRANNLVEADRHYNITLKCYNFLKKEIASLNMLYSKRNAVFYNQNKKTIQTITQFSYLIIALMFCICFFIVYIAISTITQPLIEISKVAHKVAERDFDIPLFNRNSHDEIGNICQAFDRMIISIREYIDTIWEKALKENELHEKELEMQTLYTDAKLRSLQNQINPHFLFNTLNTGAQLAMMEKADKTCLFLEQTSNFFRYNIQQSGKDSSIAEEIGLVENFMYIMTVRFGDRYEFIKQIPDDAFTIRIPRMILQPLVENSIKHGLKNIVKGGKIILAIQKNRNTIDISISDNGCGIPNRVRTAIFAKANSSAGISDYFLIPEGKNTFPETTNISTGTGLINVITRLRLFFQKDDIFEIKDGPNGQGTTFLLRIPYV